ncbi:MULTISPECIES: PFL_4703 family integrating conjugative element protein [Pasteurellaceae]|uniref:TIGR03746 family integrating conjugative element protein n=3 Tax=Pasteurellaceae TaxID=712 RepID=A0A084EZ96_GLAPU|nr:MULTISPECIES: TIGR03746 family integrating conjugative element protein [Pasteurellaceae]EQA02259.1 hypothetical protein HPSMNH_0603 [Glaesserella parasuis MN-H]QOF66880.1 TIGR03746 family integrating conjugative element protein [Actinobacillus sp. GY-402]QRX38418.1 integrating conjugative element protein [Actinobacillus sp.]AUI65872.1 TIGR03746 family integrating conjugative element protein [Glaesserella sp. 15-184]KEZ23288.1 integrating conjugative element protein, family [Glaesserella par
MSKYKHALTSERFHIQSLRLVILILTIISGIFAYGWYSSPKYLTIHNPPDLRSGSVRAWWEVPPSTVYAFSFYIFQQLNRWPQDGEVDYKKNIEALQAYLTPHCYQFLLRDYENRNLLGELRNRVRGVYEIPGRGFSQSRVTINSQDDWDVTLDLSTDEYYLDNPVKRVLVRYPLHIVRYDLNPEANPWGLALNCYRSTPKRIEIKVEEEKK